MRKNTRPSNSSTCEAAFRVLPVEPFRCSEEATTSFTNALARPAGQPNSTMQVIARATGLLETSAQRAASGSETNLRDVVAEATDHIAEAAYGAVVWVFDFFISTAVGIGMVLAWTPPSPTAPTGPLAKGFFSFHSKASRQ